MARLTDLADELLSLIVSHLDHLSLIPLALVSRRCCSVAQETLFRNVNLLANPLQERSLVVSLLRTLRRHPRLAASVRQLSVHNPFVDKEDFEEEYDSEEQEIIRMLASPYKELEEAEFRKRVGQGAEDRKKVEKEEADIRTEVETDGGTLEGIVRPLMAVLLAQVPKLEHLTIFERMYERTTLSLPNLVGEDAQGMYSHIPDISKFSGLSSLRTLRLHGDNFLFGTWYALPNLQRLELDCYQDYNDCNNMMPECRHEPNLDVLHTLLLRCSAFYLVPHMTRNFSWGRHGWSTPNNPFDVLREFPFPKRVEVEIVNVAKVSRMWKDNEGHEVKNGEEFIVRDACHGSYDDFFVNYMQELGHQLQEVESFSIRLAADDNPGDVRENIFPAISFAFLSGVKELTFQEHILFKWGGAPDLNHAPLIEQALPGNIETLRISECHYLTLLWLEQLLDVQHSFPAFAKVYIEFDNDAARKETETRCVLDDYCKRFEDVGIEVACW